MKYKVLLVDDNNELRMLLKLCLSQKFMVETASNGLEAFYRLENEFTPDIIVSDVMMPDVDGLTLTRQIKVNEKYAHIPVIILSSIDKDAFYREFFQIGASDYLLKPFSPKELIVRIENILETVA